MTSEAPAAAAGAVAGSEKQKLNGMGVKKLKALCRQMGISAASKDAKKLRQAILAAKRDGIGEGQVLFADNPTGRDDDEEVLWDVRLGRQRVADGEGFWQEDFDEGYSTVAEAVTQRKYVGFTHLSDSDNLLAIQFCHGSVPLPGCKGNLGDSRRILAAISADAAAVSNIGVFQRKLTTVAHRWLAFGYRNDDTDADRCCKHQLRETVHSAADAVNLGISISPDDSAFSEATVSKYLQQADMTEENGGTNVSFVSYLPPLLIRRWEVGGPTTSIPKFDPSKPRAYDKNGMWASRGCEGPTHFEVVRTGVTEQAREAHAKTLVSDCIAEIVHILTGDGAFLNMGDGVSISATLNDPDSNATKMEQGQGFDTFKILKGERPDEALAARDAAPYFLQQVRFCNPVDSQANRKMQFATREPEFTYGVAPTPPPPPCDASGSESEDDANDISYAAGSSTKRKGSLAQQASSSKQQKGGKNGGRSNPPKKVSKQKRKEAAGSRDAAAPPNPKIYADPDLQGWYDHDSWHPKLPADLTIPVAETIVIRVPVKPPQFGERNLPGLWKNPMKNRRQKGKCIMHAAMRSGVNCISRMVQVILTDFEEGKENNRQIIEQQFNEKFRALGWNIQAKLNPKAKTPKCYELSLSGSLVTKLKTDGILLEDQDLDALPVSCVYKSKLLEIIKATLIRLGRRDHLQELHGFAKVHRWWAMAMKHGYRMRPTADDRAKFTEYARWYYLSKCFYFGHVIWYDWQLFYAFPQLCAAPAPIKPGILHECALSMR